MKIIRMKHGLKTLVDNNVFKRFGHLKWYVSTLGYVIRFETGRRYVALHRLILNPPAGLEVDHINRNRLDNRRRNLRLCTKAQNQGNRLGSRKSGFKGVCWSKRDRVWRAGITRNKKPCGLGVFPTAKLAARAYNRAARAYFGKFALLNKIPR